MLIVCPSCASRYSIEDEKIGETGRMVRCASCRTAFFITLADDQTGKDPPAGKTASSAGAALGETSGMGTASADSAAPLGQEGHGQEALGQDDLDALFASEMAAAAQAEPAAADTPGDGAANPDIALPPAVLRAKASKQGSKGKAGAKARPPKTGLTSGARQSGRASGRGLAWPLAMAALGCALIAAGLWQREAVARAVPQSAGLYAAIGLPVNPRGLAFGQVRSNVFSEGEARFLVVEGQVRNIRDAQTPVPLIAIDVRGEDGRSLYQWTTEPPRLRLNGGETLHFRARLATPPEAGRQVEVRFADRPLAAEAGS
jgi:predicted Zn finger-like uncharacterized protein